MVIALECIERDCTFTSKTAIVESYNHIEFSVFRHGYNIVILVNIIFIVQIVLTIMMYIENL